MKDLLTKDNLILYGTLFILLVSIGFFNLDISGLTHFSLEDCEKSCNLQFNLKTGNLQKELGEREKEIKGINDEISEREKLLNSLKDPKFLTSLKIRYDKCLSGEEEKSRFTLSKKERQGRKTVEKSETYFLCAKYSEKEDPINGVVFAARCSSKYEQHSPKLINPSFVLCTTKKLNSGVIRFYSDLVITDKCDSKAGYSTIKNLGEEKACAKRTDKSERLIKKAEGEINYLNSKKERYEKEKSLLDAQIAEYVKQKESCFGICSKENTPHCTLEDWSIGEWEPSTCPQSEIQTRTVTKVNNCVGDTGKPAESQSCEDQNKDFLIERKERLLNLIETDPDAAWEFPELESSLISGLTSNLQQNIEQRGEFTGEIEVLHADDFEHPENSRFLFFLNDKGKKYQLYSSKKLPVLLSGTRVKVKGLALDNKMALTSLSDESLIKPLKSQPITGNLIAPPLNTNENLGEQKTLVLLINVNGKGTAPIDIGEAERLIFGGEFETVRDFYLKNSYDKVSLSGDVYSVTIDPSCDTLNYPLNKLLTLNPNIQISDYERIIFFLPGFSHTETFIDKDGTSVTNNCDFSRWGGLGTIGKTIIDLEPDGIPDVRASISWNFYGGLYIASHELGHNFGAHHANAFMDNNYIHCNDIFRDDCESKEYQNPFSVMGVGVTYHHTAAHKYQIGWITNDNTQITEHSGTYFLSPVEEKPASSSIQQIILPISEVPKFYKDILDSFKLGDNELSKMNVVYSIEFRYPMNYDEHHPDLDVLDKNSWQFTSNPIVLINMAFLGTEEYSNVRVQNTLLGAGAYKLQPTQSYIDQRNGYEIKFEEMIDGRAKIRINNLREGIATLTIEHEIRYVADRGSGRQGQIIRILRTCEISNLDLICDAGQEIYTDSEDEFHIIRARLSNNINNFFKLDSILRGDSIVKQCSNSEASECSIGLDQEREGIIKVKAVRGSGVIETQTTTTDNCLVVISPSGKIAPSKHETTGTGSNCNTAAPVGGNLPEVFGPSPSQTS